MSTLNLKMVIFDLSLFNFLNIGTHFSLGWCYYCPKSGLVALVSNITMGSMQNYKTRKMR